MINVKLFRIIRKKSQFQVSLASGIPSYRISSIENGRIKPTRKELKRLAETLGTTPDVLERENTEEVLVGQT